MEDPEKRNIFCFVRNVDEGNLFVHSNFQGVVLTPKNGVKILGPK